MPRSILPRVPCWLLAFLSGAMLRTQAPGEFDFDATQLPLVGIIANNQPAVGSHTITGQVVYTGQNLELNAALQIASGAELRLVDSVLVVRGNVTIGDRARLVLIGSTLSLPCVSQGQFQLRNEGYLHTERSQIGSGYVGSTLVQTTLLHLRGTWLARDTVVQGLVTLLANGRSGHLGNPYYRGGSVFAKGLYEGDRADAVHMIGMGDGEFIDGTMNIGLYFDASGSAGPASLTIDLDSRNNLNVVYGDPMVHTGLTQAMPAAPYRLALSNHRSPTWQFFAENASSSGPVQTITLRNAEDIICNFRGENLVGSPQLGGPWSSHYAELPGLPSTGKPGHHAMPPGCSVQLGNVIFRSGSGLQDWNRIRSWGVYARGTATDLLIQGPTLLSELRLTDGTMRLQGTGSFDMGLRANTARLFQTARLFVDNAAIGEFGSPNATPGLIEANNSSLAILTRSRVAPTRLRVNSAAAGIEASTTYGPELFIQENPGGGNLQVRIATPLQATDLQNLGFEAGALSAGVPPYWSGVSTLAALVANPAPSSAGQWAFEAGAGTAIAKNLLLPAGTFVDLVGAARYPGAVGSGQWLLSVGQGAATSQAALATVNPGGWQRLRAPTFTVAAGWQPVALSWSSSASPGLARLDDVRCQIGSWWDHDNLGNLGFELGCRHQGHVPTYWSAPDCWRSSQLRCEPDASVVRPGAAPGSRSVRCSLQGALGNIWKDLTFLRAGEVIRVTGWVRGVSANSNARMQAIVGNGPNYFQNVAPNVFSPIFACDGVWRQFTLDYTVPANPIYTHIDIYMNDAAGSQCWFDDVTVVYL